MSENDDPNPEVLPIDGTLDLHTFAPADVKELIPEYLEACRQKGILQVRIVHGKGTGVLRRVTHSALERSAAVLRFELADATAGGWGATLVELRPLSVPGGSSEGG